MKLSLEEIQGALAAAKIPNDQQKAVVEHLQEVIQELEAEKSSTKLPHQKNEYGVVLYDADGSLAGKDLTASVYTIPQGGDHGTVLARIAEAVRDQNEAAKRKKNVIKTIGEAFAGLKRKFIKAKNINLKTKESVRVLVTNNKFWSRKQFQVLTWNDKCKGH